MWTDATTTSTGARTDPLSRRLPRAGRPRGPQAHAVAPALPHHYASLLIKHGESVKTLSERLGHTNAAMTLNIYTLRLPRMSSMQLRSLVGVVRQDEHSCCFVSPT